MTSTDQYIAVLASLKTGDIGILRTLAGKRLDTSLEGFDLFAGLWWPLRQTNKRAPRREVAWLIAKVFAQCPVPHIPGSYLAHQLGRFQPNETPERERYCRRFDRMLGLSVGQIEPELQWAVNWVVSNNLRIDWVRLTDDLSIWDREYTRLKWAEQFLKAHERIDPC